MLISSVLPGLRDIRAPLSAGFLWILVIWLAVRDSVPVESAAGGVYATGYDFAAILDGAAAGVALTFAAYLLGTVSLALLLVGYPDGCLWSPRMRILPRRGIRPGRRASERSVRAPWGRRGQRLLIRIGATSADSLQTVVARLADLERGESRRSGSEDPATAEELALRRMRRLDMQRYGEVDPSAWTMLDMTLARPTELYDVLVTAGIRYHNLGDTPGKIPLRSLGGPPRIVKEVNPARRVLEEEIANRVVDDFSLMRTRLMRPQTRDLSGAIERLRSEAELRAAVAPPLLVIVVEVAIETHRPAWLIAAVGVLVLAVASLRRRREAGDMLLDALGDRVKSPTLERLASETAQLG